MQILKILFNKVFGKIFFKLGISDTKSFKAFVLQFLKFGIVGISNNLIHLLVYYSLLYLGFYYILSNVTAFVIAMINSFYWNRRFVFKSHDGKKGIQLFRFFLVNGFVLLLGTGLMYVIVHILNISEFIAPLLLYIVTIPTSFLLNKFWSFRDNASKESK